MNVVTSACPLSGSWLLARWLSTELTRQSSQTQSKRSSTQKGQYANANTDYFKNLAPFEPCVEAAARLLSGERVLNEPSVVFQSGGVQGSGVYLELYSSYYGYTYLCYSSYPELYGG